MRHFGLISILIATQLSAEPVSPWWTQAKLGAFDQQGIGCLKDSLGLGVGVGTWLTPRWGLEADLVSTTLRGKYDGAKASEGHLNAAALFNLKPEATVWVPYLRAGLGFSRVESPYSFASEATVRPSYHAGLGVQRLFGAQGVASLEARALNVETRERRTEYQTLLGLGWRWGAKAAPAPVMVPVPRPLPAPEPVKPVEAIKPPEPVIPPPTPTPAPAPEPVKAPPAKIILDEALLHFANNQATLPPEAVEAIRTVAKGLKSYGGSYSLVVSGHTSSLGGVTHNKALSLRRAQAVAEILIQEGIPADHIQTLGMGPDKPLADNKTREGQAKNRRVEIDVKASGIETKRTETQVLDQAPAPVKAAKPAKSTKGKTK